MSGRPPRRLGRSTRLLARVSVACCCALCALVPGASALPDNRAYELVTRVASGAGSEAVTGLTPDFLASAVAGGAVDWEGFGGCCGASSGALNLFQSVRGPAGWQTQALTPKPSEPLSGFFGEQAPMAWTSELDRTVFATPVSYAAGDRRPRGAHAYDLYLQDSSDGALKWLSQGPSGTGSSPASSELDGATPSLGEVVFSSAESLTPNAEGLGSENAPPQYLYLRNIAAETTSLLDVNNSGALISPYGATLGNGNWLHEELVPPDYMGTTTNAISQDGSKVFFEAPPSGVADEVEGAGSAHLYMRHLSTGVTTPLDEPGSSGSARYEGASANGSLVFFTSNEGLDGAPRTNELYEFNTTSGAIGPAPAMSAIAVGGDKGVVGETAIANNGATVYFVSDSVLASNQNPLDANAVANEPNLYAYATASGQTTFVATLAWPDVNACDPDCASEHLTGLVAQPDIVRPAYPTPDGTALVFASSADITGQAGGPRTTLSDEARGGERTLQVASTSGFAAGQTITIGSGPEEELDTIEAVDSPSEITLSEYGPDGLRRLAENHPADSPVARLIEEVYRYSATAGSLECLSCLPVGAMPAGSASLGPPGAGGSYAPDGRSVPISENGAQVFFQSPDPLVPEAQSPPPGAVSPPDNVYEWENGQIQLISNGSDAGFALDGTTPSGNDVFISTHVQLTGIDTGGDLEIYDASVGGGLPETPLEGQPCSGETCSTSALGVGLVPFGPLPGSAILRMEEQGPSTLPTLAVVRVTAAQLHHFARTGRLILTVAATTPGTIVVTASASPHGKPLRVAHATATLKGAATASLTLTLDRMARRLLARAGTLALRIKVSDSDGATATGFALRLRAATATATTSHGRHA